MKVGVVGFIGRPNVGKSTLLNQILKEKISITSAKAQTTRDSLLGILNTPESQVVFVDTPGFHDAKTGGLNAWMLDSANKALEGVDLLWVLLEGSQSIATLKPIEEALSKAEPIPFLILVNKQDILKKTPVLLERSIHLVNHLKEQFLDRCKGVYEVSGLNGTGVETVLERSLEFLKEGELLFPDTEILTNRPMRYLAAERIRENLFALLDEEVPYSCAVDLKTYKETPNRVHIEAVIFVEKESQKGILIGKGGAMIKQIGTNSRKSIQEFVGTPVDLRLKIDVLKNWTKDPVLRKRLGYTS